MLDLLRFRVEDAICVVSAINVYTVWLSQKVRLNTTNNGSSQHLGILHAIIPSEVSNLLETSEMKGVYYADMYLHTVLVSAEYKILKMLSRITAI